MGGGMTAGILLEPSVGDPRETGLTKPTGCKLPAPMTK